MSCSWGSVMGRISVPVVWYFKMFYFIIALGVFDFLLLQSFFFNLLAANRLPHTPTKCHILHLEAYWSNVSVHRKSPSLPSNPFTFCIFCSLCQWHLGVGMVGKEQTLNPGCSGRAIEEEGDERSLNLLLSLSTERSPSSYSQGLQTHLRGSCSPVSFCLLSRESGSLLSTQLLRALCPALCDA